MRATVLLPLLAAAAIIGDASGFHVAPLAGGGALAGGVGRWAGNSGFVSQRGVTGRAPHRLGLRGSGRRGAACQGVRGASGELLASSSYMGKVQHVKAEEEFEELTAQPLAVVALQASTCRKCHAVSGKFVSIANQYSKHHPEAVFGMVQLDKLRTIATITGVTKTPTYMVFVDGKKVDELVGSDEVHVVVTKIKTMIKQWTNAPDTVTLSRDDSEESSEGEGEAAARVVDKYSPKTMEASVEASVEADDVSVDELGDDEIPVVPEGEDDCGDDGCEIVWD